MSACPLCQAQAGDGLVCAGCVANALYYKQQSIAYKKVALRDVFDQAKAALAARRPLRDEEQALTAVLRRQGELKERLHQTAERVRGLRPTVARKKFMLEDRRRALNAAAARLAEMERAQEGRAAPVLEGLRWYTEQVREAMHQRMWTRVLEHFVILPIEADLPYQHQQQPQPSSRTGASKPPPSSSAAPHRPHPPYARDHLFGVSTIAGLPLPNSGRYNSLGLPDEVCEAALYLVARLTWSLANTFQVTLPHPLLFPVGKPYAVIAEDVHRRTEYVLSPTFHKKARGDRGSGGGSGEGRSGGGGKGAGNGGGGGDGRSTAPRTPDGEAADPFHIGLEYLQYDVHRLAISEQVGVDLSELWGKEALLLNLWAIQQHAARLVQSYESVPDLPLPVIRRHALVQGQQQPSRAPQQQPPPPQPRVVFQDRPDSDWSLVDLHLKGKDAGGRAAGGGGGFHK